MKTCPFSNAFTSRIYRSHSVIQIRKDLIATVNKAIEACFKTLIYLIVIIMVGIGSIWLRIGTSGGLL
jgi:hypothetical protein